MSQKLRFLLGSSGILALAACSSRPEGGREIASIGQRPPYRLHLTEPVANPQPETRLQAHVEHSLRLVAWRFGVSTSSLENFQSGYRRDTQGPDESLASETCLESLQNDRASREALLVCLRGFGTAGLNERLYAGLFEKRYAALGPGSSVDEERHLTAGLLHYVEELTRENLHYAGRPYAWFQRRDAATRGNFLKSTKHGDFPYEDGDLVLSFSNTSISALIPNSTLPQRRFSHAFIMRVRDGKYMTAESIIEKGVITASAEEFREATKNNLLVLRWKDAARRREIAARASDFAWQQVQRKAKYNIAIDWSDETRFFCNQLVAKAYSVASGIPVTQVAPDVSRVRTPKLLAYLKELGVGKSEMPSPGDFISSPSFEVVAEYRRSDDPLRAWELLSMGDVFTERLDAGFVVRPSAPIRKIINAADAVNSALKSSGNEGLRELSFLPEALTPRAISLLAAQDRVIFSRAFRMLENAQKQYGSPRTLRFNSPWYIRGQLSFLVERDGDIRQKLVFPAAK